MTLPAEQLPVGIAACDCLTALGDADATAAALLAGTVALQLRPVLGRDGGDPVPLALAGAASVDEAFPPRWLGDLKRFARRIPAAEWGTPRRPVMVTSSNFGVGSMHAYTRDHDGRHLGHGPPFATVELLQREFGWGPHVHVFSHACVTAHLGLAQAARLLHAGLADEVLVFSFDFVSPFVAGGFHSLKILNGAIPAPFAVRDTGAIGLGDGAAFAVLTRGVPDNDNRFRIEAHALHNEMHHFTGNQPEGAGFAACLEAIGETVRDERVWVKGHGTGTLEAGRLEAEAIARVFPNAPLVSWKGSLGHTLGSCGLVELAIAIAAIRRNRIPSTVGGARPAFADNVALEPLDATAFDAAVLTSNAFGGAHAAMVLRWSGTKGEPSLPAAMSRLRTELFIHRVHVERPPVSETAAEARERLGEKFPRAALRRMTHLGMLVGASLDGVAIAADDALVYATSFAETRALEDFLTSFPTPSPLLFQTSIHPSGVQQVLIGRQQPVARVWPLAGRARLVEQALLTALLEPARHVVITGGEERGTWLLEQGMASERSFAFGLLLTSEAEGAIGCMRFDAASSPLREKRDASVAVPALPSRATPDDDPCPALGIFADTLVERRSLTWRGAGGAWSIEWR